MSEFASENSYVAESRISRTLRAIASWENGFLRKGSSRMSVTVSGSPLNIVVRHEPTFGPIDMPSMAFRYELEGWERRRGGCVGHRRRVALWSRTPPRIAIQSGGPDW